MPVGLNKSFAGVDAVFGTLKVPVPAEVSAAIGATVNAALTPTPIRMDVLLAKAPTIKLLDGGVGTGSAHDFVAFRFECGPLDDSPYAPASEADRVAAVTAWTQFYGGGVQRLLSHNDWSLSIDGGLLAIAAEQAGREALAKRHDLTVEGPVKTAWGAPFDPNVLNVNFTVDLHNACPYEGLVLGDTNVRVAMSLTARFDAAYTDELEEVAHKTLRTTVDIARDIDDGDALTCDISVGIIGAVAGAVVGGLGGPLGTAIGAIYGFIAGFAAAASIGASASIPALVPGTCYVTKTPGLFDSDEQQVCTVPMRMSMFGALDPALQDVLPRPGGLYLSGVFVPRPPLPVPAPLKLTTTGFEVQLSDVCNRNLTREFFLASIFTSEATNICDARVLNDRVGQFGGVTINSDWAPVSVLVPLDLKPKYLADPYDCEVLVTSSTGVRRVVIPAISALTETERAALAGKLEGARRAQCIAPIVPLFQGEKMLPHKLVWEPTVDPAALELTEIFIGGLPPGEQVVRDDRDAGTVTTATATRDGLVRVFTLAPPATTDGQVTLQRTGTGNVEPGSYSQRAVLLTPTATLTATESVLDVSAGTLEGRPTLITLCGYGADVYYLASPAQPLLRYQRIEPGLRGAEPYGDRMLTWGSQGLALLKSSGSTRARRDVLTEAPVTDVARRGDLAYVLTDAGITVYDLASGAARGPTPIAAHALALVSTSLAAATDNGLRLFDLADLWSPAQAYEMTMSGITALRHPGTNTTRHLLEVQNDDGTILLDAHTPSDPVEVSRSPAGAGLLAVARVGRIFARLNVREGDVTVYYVRRPARSLYAL